MIKKITKILLKIIIIFIVFILLVLLSARIFFPPRKLKTIAISKVEPIINRKLDIGDVWFNPLRGISLKNIVIYEKNADGIADSTWFFKVDNILLKYRFFALFKKEIEISKIKIEKPSINLMQDEFSHWNFEDLVSPADTTKIDSLEIVAADTAAEFILPLSIDLKELLIDKITANLTLNQDGTIVTVKSGGITIDIQNMQLPRNSFT